MNELLKPIRIGNMVVKNRMVMAPMNTNFTNENGAVTEQMTAYFTERAKSEVGMFVVEAASVVGDILNHGVQPLMTEERFVPGWFNLTDQLHAYGAKVSIELVHYGSEGSIGPRVSASDVSSYPGSVHELSVAEILIIEEQFAAAARRARQAGFDAITLHAAHGYLLAEFLSPLYNKRTDEYGGTLVNRTRIVTEIIEKCKQALGAAFPVMVRFSANEFVTGGRAVKESVQLAKIMEEAGAAALDLSACVVGSYMFSIRPNNIGAIEGFLVPYAKEIKKAVSIPVICAGGMREPDKMNQILKSGDADMITLGRALLADEEFCKKVYEHRENEIRRCMSCQECLATLNSGKSVRCAVNPKTGREHIWVKAAKDESKRKKIIVIGAGPAGMSAALELVTAGHRVLLCDREEKLGGTIRAAAVPPGKKRIQDLTDWYDYQLKKAGIELRLGEAYTEELAKDWQADTVIIAAGATYMRRIKGSDNACVMTAKEALLHPEKVGDKVVIIGGGASGAETAEYFSDEKVNILFAGMKDVTGSEVVYSTKARPDAHPKEISIVEMQDAICTDMYADNACIMRVRLKEYGVKQYVSTKVKEIKDHEIVLTDMKDNKDIRLEADTVILAAGLTPNTVDIKNKEYRIYCIGDSNKPGKIKDAIYTGTMLGRLL